MTTTENAARGVSIKTDATPYVHRRTGEVYLARHAGLMKIGHHGNREAWVECVMYQKAEAPSQWFARDLAAFVEQFIERRELALQVACEQHDVDVSVAPRVGLEKWSVMGKTGRLTGDRVQGKTVTQDFVTEEAQAIDRQNRFALVNGVVYDLAGDEVTLG